MDNVTAAMAKALGKGASKAENALAWEVLKDTSPFVPFLTGTLNKEAKVYGSSIVYPGPYAHYLYEGVVYVDPVTKAAGFLTKDGWKSRKGVTKVRTDKPLDIKKRPGHGQAQSKWFEASKAQNKDKWVKLAGKDLIEEVKGELK